MTDLFETIRNSLADLTDTAQQLDDSLERAVAHDLLTREELLRVLREVRGVGGQLEAVGLRVFEWTGGV